MIAGSLFSGAGVGDLGLEWAGFKHAWFCEINEYARQVLELRFPGVPIYADINGREIESAAPVDLVIAGFPCKQTSTISNINGNRVGLAGKDSGHAWRMLEVFCTLCTPWLIVENPVGVGRWADQIQTCLEDFGYTVSKPEFALSDCGAPHQRRRVFFVANRFGKRLAQPKLSKSSALEHGAWAQPGRGFWREDQPGTWRMDDGSAHRMDRLECIGNGLSPVQAYVLGRAVMAAEAA